jgi:hypothetical protein
MNIRAKIADVFRAAVADPTNILKGELSWDFVEADVMIEIGIDNIIEQMGSLEAFYPYFNQLVDLHLAMEAA